MIAERVPRQLRDQAVVLVEILPMRGENQVRKDGGSQLVEERHQVGAKVGEHALLEVLRDDLCLPRPGQERVGTLQRLVLPLAGGAQHHPVHADVGVLLEQP